jgi:transcriptional regulator GlxA family with amidase domain
MSEPNPLRAAVLAPPDFTASTLFGVYDLLAAAGRDWDLVVRGVMGTSRIQPALVARSTGRLQASNGTWLEPDYTFEDFGHPDIVCIPDLFIAPEESLAGRYDTEIEWIRRWYEAGSVIGTACAGSLLLAEAGVLDGLDAASHWGYCDIMAERYPEVRVQPNRALVVTGHEQRIVMAGGGSSWHDMALYLIARLLGIEEAMRVARVYLIDWHHVGQQPFASLSRTRQVDDAVIARCQEWIAQNYHHDSPVAAMTELSGLADRSFKRRFSKATGMTPIEYVQTLRLEEAKQILETTDTAVEAVANEVGYEDPSYFGRLFKRTVGLTPAQYRKRFGGLRKVLEQTA